MGIKSDAEIRGTAGDDELSGTLGRDLMYGLGGNDELHGDEGNDQLFGAGGNDNLFGDAGNDILDGAVGNDSLNGGDGRDTLMGGAGNDELTGGAGVDKFVIANAGGLHADTITDFVSGEDKIQLDNSYFSSMGDGRLANSSFKANATGTAEDGDDFIVLNTTTGELFYDPSGDATGSSKLIAIIGVGTAIKAGDIEVI